MGKVVLKHFLCYFVSTIKSFSYLQITRTNIKSHTGFKFAQIPVLIVELAALECLIN